MQTVVVVNSKGGSGKTTVCALLALGLVKFGGTSSVGVMDCDPQQSLKDCIEMIGTPGITVYPETTRFGDLPDAQRPSFLMVDTPGFAQSVFSRLPRGDLYIVPTLTAVLDVKTAAKTVRYLEQMVGNKPIRVMFNQVNSRAKGSRPQDLADLMDYLQATRFQAQLGLRQAYRQMQAPEAEGGGLGALKGPARTELQELVVQTLAALATGGR